MESHNLVKLHNITFDELQDIFLIFGDVSFQTDLELRVAQGLHYQGYPLTIKISARTEKKQQDHGSLILYNKEAEPIQSSHIVSSHVVGSGAKAGQIA